MKGCRVIVCECSKSAKDQFLFFLETWLFLTIFKKHINCYILSILNSLLYEPSCQWLGWQFVGCSKLSGDRKTDFCKCFCYSFCLRHSCGPPRHPEVSWNVSIAVIWRLNEIEKVAFLTFWKVHFFEKYRILVKFLKIESKSSDKQLYIIC